MSPQEDIPMQAEINATEKMNEIARELETAANTLHMITSQQTGRANQQAQVVEEVQRVIEKFQQIAVQVRTKAEYMTTIAGKSVDVAEQGQLTISSAVQGMRDSAGAVNLAGRAIGELAGYLRRIGEIIASVSDIATQSNFLALNAQIEAARAGEQGLGFAVVADQLREMAEESRRAVQDVRHLLKDIQKAVMTAVDAAEDGALGMEASLRDAESAAEAILRLNLTIVSSNDAAKGILKPIESQIEGVGKVHEALQALDNVATQNQAAARVAENVSQDLNRLAQLLIATLGETQNPHST